MWPAIIDHYYFFGLHVVGEKCPVESNPCGIIPLSSPDPAVTGILCDIVLKCGVTDESKPE